MAEFVGRDTEREVVERWLLDDPRPPTLLIEGEAGIGKSTLWRSGVEQAEDLGYRVLTCVAAGSETQLAFTVLRDLLTTAFDEVADELPAPQRRALAVTLLREEPDGAPPEPGTTAVAFLGALRALAAQAPTLVAVDDVQWIDKASEGPLAYALRRLGSERVGVLLAQRLGDGFVHPLGLDDLGEEHVRVLEVGGLTVGALGRILYERLGVAYPRPTLHRLHQASGGNPFYAFELARALASSAEPLRPGAPLPVPGTLQELIHDRLTSLPPKTLDALGVVATLSRPTLDLVAAALDRDPRPSLAPAVDAHVVEIDEADVRFAHPLYAASASGLVSPRRRTLHARLAQVVPDPEERARHLALATEAPDEGAAAAIEEGAMLAFARGSPAAAAELAAEARRLTRPADSQLVMRRAVAEVDYEFAAGDTARASALLDELIADIPAGRARAGLLSRQARIRHFGDDIGRSVTLLYEALAGAGDDAALRGEIEEGLAWGLLLVRRDLGDAAVHAASAARLAEERGDSRALAEALAVLAVTELVLGRGDWEETMERAVSLEESTLPLRVLRHPSFAYGYCLSCSDELDGAREVFAELERRAGLAGDESSMPSILNHLTLVECLAGRWDDATEHAEEGYERALESGQQPTRVSILAKRAHVAARRGDVDAARAGARASLAIAGAADFDPARPEPVMARGGETAIWTLGFVELSVGDPEAAHGLLSPMVDALLRAGIEEPGEIRCLPDEIEALVTLGRLDEAESLLSTYEGWARRLERPSALGSAGRCRGLVLAARGEVASAVATLAAADRTYDSTPLPFEHARTLLALGEQQRRARRRKDARETLGRAHAIFHELGAELWAGKAEAELGRIGGRAPSTGELTPTEDRVAQLVAEGKSNKQVAYELLVSVHTVEAALTSIYRKLDVRSRTELAHKLATTD